MSKRKSFDSLIEEEAQQVAQAVASPQAEATVTPTVSPKGENLETSELPKYLQMVTKTVRLRADQYEELTQLARELNRRKRGGERITENTLARVAFDLLLSMRGRLQGFDEEEIAASVLGKKPTT